MYAVRGDEPTIPNLRGYDTGGPGWPVADGSKPRTTSRDARSALLGVSLGANVALLVSILCLLLLARAGYFAPTGSSSLSSSPHASPAASPSATALSTPSPTALSGGLQVTPSSVSLGCNNGQQSQYVVLTNRGSDQVQWQAQFSLPNDQAGVTISPNQGQLRAGTSVALHLDNRSQGAGQQGVIRFTLAGPSSGAGAAPSLSYTTMGCD